MHDTAFTAVCVRLKRPAVPSKAQHVGLAWLSALGSLELRDERCWEMSPDLGNDGGAPLPADPRCFLSPLW